MTGLARAIAIRPGEGRLVMLVAGAFAAVEAGRGLGEVGVDTLVLSGPSGASVLPYLYIGLGLVGLVVTLSYGAALTRSTSERFFPGLLVVLASVLAVEWLVTVVGGGGDTEAIFLVAWISVYAAGLLLLTAMWTVGGFVFDARQAKRLFPLLTSAAIVGSLAGFLSAIVIQRFVDTQHLILTEAVLFVIAAGLLTGLGSRTKPRRGTGAAAPSVRSALTAGASYVARSPLMRLIAVAYVLLAVLMFSLTFPFMTAMSDTYRDPQDLLTVLALFSAAVTLASFLTGTLLANRLYARFGVATVALTLPIMYLAGFGVWMVRFVLSTAVIVRFAQQVTQRGLSNAAFSAFYTVIPSAQRGQVLAFMDGVPGQAGTMISGGLLIIVGSEVQAQLASGTTLGDALAPVFWLGLVTAAVAVVVLYLTRRAYASSLLTTLRQGRGEQVLEGGPGLEAMGKDAGVITGLRSATRAESSQERLLAADLLGRLGAGAAEPDLRQLWTDADARVRRAAVLACTRLGSVTFDDLVAIAREDEDERVRAAAVMAIGQLDTISEVDVEVLAGLAGDQGALVSCEVAVALGRHQQGARAQAVIDRLVTSEDAADRVGGLDAMSRIDDVDARAALDHFEDPAPAARAAAIRAAAAHDLGELAPYLERLDDPSRQVRNTAATVIQDLRRAGPALVAVLNSGSERAQEAALVGLDGHAPFVRAPLMEWSEQQVDRAIRLRTHAAVLATADATSSAAFLGSVIAKREAAIESRLLQALATLGAPEASGLIRRCLHAPDQEVRAQAIEALDALGDPGLSRGVIRLLEREGEAADASDADVIVAATALEDDRDPWVRALALRTLSEHLRAGQRTLSRRVRDDPDPLIREAVEVQEEDEAMPQSIQLVSDIDRMMALRRVPLFAALEPEDLQRVASSAREQSWADGDEIMTEGDVGDELVVIVEGGVRVVHRGHGGEHEIRTYGAGDHIGELAVLREAPRAATVIARPPGVRGLVISGEAIGALLRERPEAAMAMLATLAERLSQQA